MNLWNGIKSYASENQEEYILGKYSILGDSRRKWEDRVFAEKILRQVGDTLIVGIVADGVGSSDFGSRGAQLALDAVIHSLEKSEGNDIPDILERAIVSANNVVYQDNQENAGTGLSTLVVAIVFDNRVFIGNVGDSRAYWVPSDGKLLLLTRDHSYYNIYGGDPDSDEAGVVVNAIGKKASVQVDLGFYLKGENLDQAYKLGIAGLPLQLGDAVLLCSDGLIKNAPNGGRYIKDVEIVSALKTEHLPDHAAIKMVSAAEGRRPDDNVSAVTIQRLPGHSSGGLLPFKLTMPKISVKWLIAIVIGLFFLLGLALSVFFVRIMFSSFRPVASPALITELPILAVPNTTPLPLSVTMGNGIVFMEVQSVDGAGSTVQLLDNIKNGQQVSNLYDGGVKLVADDANTNEMTYGTLYLFGHSSATIIFEEIMKPELGKGAIYIQPGGTAVGEVHFGITDGFATAMGSRMILELRGNDIWLYCFEGDCEWHVETKATLVPAGSKMVYHSTSSTLDFGNTLMMTYNERWRWNRRCNFCMSDIIPSPTLPSGTD